MIKLFNELKDLLIEISENENENLDKLKGELYLLCKDIVKEVNKVFWGF